MTQHRATNPVAENNKVAMTQPDTGNAYQSVFGVQTPSIAHESTNAQNNPANNAPTKKQKKRKRRLSDSTDATETTAKRPNGYARPTTPKHPDNSIAPGGYGSTAAASTEVLITRQDMSAPRLVPEGSID